MKLFLITGFISSSLLEIKKENSHNILSTDENSFSSDEFLQDIEYNKHKKTQLNNTEETNQTSCSNNLISLNSNDTERCDSFIILDSDFDSSCNDFFDDSFTSLSYPVKKIISASVKDLIRQFEGIKNQKSSDKSDSMVKRRIEFFENKKN